MNPRKPIAQLALQGHKSNTRRAMERLANDPQLTSAQLRDLKALDELIVLATKSCRLGSTLGRAKKRNPAFDHLCQLIKTRETLLRGHRIPGAKSAAELLADVDAILQMPKGA